jgi:hypothetical protein
MADLKELEVLVPEEAKMGDYANAFRILPEDGNMVLLDFCVYSKQENTAKVVSRLRVPVSFLATIKNRLGEVLTEKPIEKPIVVDGLVH